MARRKELILEGDMYKAIWTLSIPLMINSLIQTLYNLADGIWVSKLSSVHFAATSFVWPVNFLFISIGFGLSIAATSILSQLYGADRVEEACEYSSQTIVISMIVSIVFTVLGYFLTPTIISLMGATGELKEFGIEYLKITFLDMPFLFLYYNINAIMTAEGDTMTPMVLGAISAILNVVLDPIFIFTLDMGIGGAAVATVISRVVLALMGIYAVRKLGKSIQPSFKEFKFDRKKIDNIARVAIPSSIGQSGSALGFIILNGFIASFGTSTMAAYGMVNRISSLIMQPMGGIGAGLATIVGQNMGADKLDRANDGFKKSARIVIIGGLIGCALMLIFDDQIINLFMRSKDDMEVIRQGKEYLRFSAFFTPLMGLFHIFQGLFQGSGHTKYSMYMDVGRLWLVRLPMILLFKQFTNLGPRGVWIAMSVSNLIVCVYGYLIFMSGNWQAKVVNEEEILI